MEFYESFKKDFPSILEKVLVELCKLQDIETKNIHEITSLLERIIDEHEKRVSYELELKPRYLNSMDPNDVLHYFAHDFAKEIIKVATTEKRRKIYETDLIVAIRDFLKEMGWGD